MDVDYRVVAEGFLQGLFYGGGFFVCVGEGLTAVHLDVHVYGYVVADAARAEVVDVRYRTIELFIFRRGYGRSHTCGTQS